MARNNGPFTQNSRMIELYDDIRHSNVAIFEQFVIYLQLCLVGAEKLLFRSWQMRRRFHRMS